MNAVRACTSRSAQAGFTLLEAIVAMVVMGTCLLALYGWLSTNTIAVTRAQAQMRAVADARSALAAIESINPMSERSGTREIPPLTVSWDSTPLTPTRPGISQAGMPTLFDFALYRLDVRVAREGAVVREFQVRRVGWVQARSGGFVE
ncbi:PulJ/GspJ family protein [Luteimonas granuli]|uniref:PulJ/GspJ family protein n=1 Tax=Luteimonas granuli TaxID=1176533 RepID=UPI00143D91B3|nr:type II secretion system protein [Luteimonas granuli]